MRTVGATLKQAIRDGYFAFLVKITTREGTVYSYTDHDRPITRDGVTYNPAPGLAPLKTYRTADQKVDSQEFASAWIDAPESDLLAGKFDEAEFVIGRTDWRDETDGGEVMIDFADQFSNITWTKEGFKAEVQNSFRKLRKIIGFKTSATCPYEFGSVLDANNPRACGKSLAAVTYTGTIAAVASKNQFTVTLSDTGLTAGTLVGGKLTFTSGANNSLAYEISAHTKSASNDVLTLFLRPVALPVVAGTVSVIRGCAKTVTACKAYSNFINFGGDPFIDPETQFK